MYKERNLPKVWMKLGGFMHQDYSIMFPDFWSGIEAFWISLSTSEKNDLVSFLDHVNNEDLPGGIPKKYWLLSGAQVVPSQVTVFLRELFLKVNALQNAKF